MSPAETIAAVRASLAASAADAGNRACCAPLWIAMPAEPRAKHPTVDDLLAVLDLAERALADQPQATVPTSHLPH